MALTDHVIVLSHLQPQVISGPPTISYEEQLRATGHPEEFIRLLRPEDRAQRVGIAGEATISHKALDVRPGGLVVEVAWPCGCGIGLHVHHDFVLGAWAKHVAAEEGLDADHLEKHAVQSITMPHEGRTVVSCLCGVRCEVDGYLPDAALDLWAQHVRGDV